MAAEYASLTLGHAVAPLAAVAAPLFRRLGLGAVLGCLCAGVLIGPFGLGLFRHSESILHVAELGVLLFLFLIGLEMRPSKLWALRAEIFGLGLVQVLSCGALLVVLGSALFMQWGGLSMAMGAFLAGVLLSHASRCR